MKENIKGFHKLKNLYSVNSQSVIKNMNLVGDFTIVIL